MVLKEWDAKKENKYNSRGDKQRENKSEWINAKKKLNICVNTKDAA